MELKQALQAVFHDAQEKFFAPSYSATVYYKGELFSFGEGFSNLEDRTGSNDKTLYAIGSCTKSFVAGAICSLVDRGMLKLDDTVKTYIPEFEMMDPYVTQHLTIRDMLCHRCGLPRHELSWYGHLQELTQADIIKMFRYLTPNQPFRYVWQYNNQMFALAGFLIERVTGKPWQQVVRENIWEPLGITRAAFGPDEATKMDNCASPYLYDLEKKENYLIPHAAIGQMGAAGCIYMATSELIKWDIMLMHGGEFEGKRVLSEKMVSEMTAAQMIRPENAEPFLAPITGGCAYGLGLMNEYFRGQKLVHHGGHIDGFMADQSFLPSQDFALAVLTNVGVHRAAMVMRYSAAETLLGGDVNIPAEMEKYFAELRAKQSDTTAKLWEEQPKNAPCPVAMEAICGTYHDNGYGTVVLSMEEDRLKLQMGTLVMYGTHYANQFFYLEEPNTFPGVAIEANLVIDAKAKVIGLDAAFDMEGPEKIHFRKIS